MDEEIIYIGIGTNSGKQVDGEDALDYAMRNCGAMFRNNAEDAPEYEDFKEAIVEWYYSGDWIEVKI